MATASISKNQDKNPVMARSVVPQNRFLFIITLVITFVTVATFIFYLISALSWRSRPFIGMTVSPTLAVNAGTPSGNTNWAGLAAGLRYQDRITAINGQALFDTPTDYVGARARFQSILAGLKLRETITVTFERSVAENEIANPAICDSPQNGISQCEVSYIVGRVAEEDFLVYFIVPYISGLIVLGIGIAIFRLRSNQSVAMLVTITCMLMAIFMGGIFSYNTLHQLAPFWLTATVFSGGMLATVGMIFPSTLRLVVQRPYLRFVPTAVSAILSILAILFWYAQGTSQNYMQPVRIATITNILGAVLLGVFSYLQRRRSINDKTRDQSTTILIGVIVVIIPALLWVLVQFIQMFINPQARIPFSTEAMMPFAIPPAASIAYAVLQYRQLNTDRIITQTVGYLVMVSALVIGYFLLVLGVNLIATNAISASDPLLVALTVFGISLLFVPLRVRLQENIDKIYFRTRRDYQEKTEKFAQQLTTLSGIGPIVKTFKDLLEETISPTNTFVFLTGQNSPDYMAYGTPEPETDIRFAQDSGIVSLLSMGDHAIYLEAGQPWPPELQVDRPRLSILKARFIAGIAGSNELSGFVIVGPPRSGANKYTFEELRFLMNAIRQFGLAVERSQVIASLQGRVRELDVLSQVGQAVNFTIEFDDLLELINAQTSRLIDASYFYIALHDPTTNQLYFAFFLENDERIREKENLRWALGRDLFSEIVRTGKPQRVEDYGRALAQRDVKIIYENSHLQAWMGVPLIAGPRTLGVIAVGKIAHSETYSDEQMKIFSDIGALAATSIEKARLFAETNMRARQLTALNEISHQLVATESDVEKLLDIITTSAVEILNAEAGSLLLTADDDSGDLEFSVVVGGSGEELIGTRLKAGHGLVGTVAKTGKPEIVNDVTQDPRHGGEVSPGEFHTNSILAVPLITKENVIGVLEVLNKKDGTIYVDQDVELLTTFAGQAAIAIENARLFQMTDLQLTKRVEELEVLERIDVELNRTLDMAKVAEITIRWAIANSGASAGLLGIVTNEEPPRLHVIAKYGYMEEDYPKGAEDNLWPLTGGIVSRVIRTKQADLATDTKIDPDYVPSLRDSLSQITIPMFSGDEINAILVLETDREPRLNLSDWGFAQRLTEHASIAISNAQLYEELTAAIESKSEFMGFAAHELKNPLSSVKGYTDVLLNGMTGKLDDQQMSFLNIIRTNTDRIQTIINDLRDAARAEADQLSIELAPTNIWHVTIETLRPFQKQLDDKQQDLINDVEEDLPLIMGDQNRLIQVMTNLVSNAYKYSPPDSHITISAKVIPNYRNKKGVSLGNVLRVSVADTGIGMSKEDLGRLFKEQYFRSDDPRAHEQPGTGLGMMITKNIIEGHGGEIWAESELNVGTTFHMVIPLAKEETAEAEEISEVASD